MKQFDQKLESLIASIKSRLGPMGFRPIRGEKTIFRKVTETGWQSVKFAIIRHPGQGFAVVCNVSVRFDQVEGGLHKVNHTMSEVDKNRTATIGAELGNLAGTGQQRWTLDSATDANFLAESIAAAFCKYGMPFFKQFSQLSDAFEVLRSNKEIGWLYSPFHVARCKRAVAAALALNQQNLVPSIILESRQFLSQQGVQELAEFDLFIHQVVEVSQ